MTRSDTGSPLRVLYISPLFIPLADPEAYCGAQMALALMGEGVDLRVLQDPRYLDRPEAVCDSSTMWKALDKVRCESLPVKEGFVRAFFDTLRYQGYSRWADSALKTARKLHEEKPFDFVYSRSLPMQAHMVGYWCSRKFGIPWVANVNDPWDKRFSPASREKPPNFFRAFVLTRWLHITLKEAALVTFPSRRLAEQTLEAGGVACNMAVIPHVGASVPGTSEPGIFRIVYAGLLGFDAYQLSSEGLFAGLHRFLDARPEARKVTRLTFLSPDLADRKSYLRQMGIDENIEHAGRLPFEDAVRWMAKASVCLLIESPVMKGVPLPSKLAHYITARKPVLTLSLPQGTVADMCPDPGLIRVDPDDAEGIAKALEMLYDASAAGRLDEHQPSKKLVERFDPSHVARQFLAACHEAGAIKSD